MYADAINDNQRFSQVYESTFDRVYAYLSACFDSTAADDLSQQVFVNVWRSMTSKDFTAPCDWNAWVFRIAINVKNDYLRSKYRRGTTVSIEDYDRPQLPFDDRVIDSTAVEKALNMLSSEEKDLLLLKAEGFSSKEIGTVLDMPDSTVRSRLSAAKKRFKKALAECGVDTDD